MSILICSKCKTCNVIDIFGKCLKWILNILRKLSTYQYIYEKYLVFLKYRFFFFYIFLPTFVLVKRKGYLSFTSMKGMGGGELLWRNLLPVGMKQIKNCSTVTVKGF